jgi:hypothetical protein
MLLHILQGVKTRGKHCLKSLIFTFDGIVLMVCKDYNALVVTSQDILVFLTDFNYWQQFSVSFSVCIPLLSSIELSRIKG